WRIRSSSTSTPTTSTPVSTPPQLRPYTSAARIADSSCFPQYTASLKCLETNQDKSKCQQQFDNYKECKKREGAVACVGQQVPNLELKLVCSGPGA
uniref:CHCH domain-containing protein n=1 Tax=Aegilops tauschii subsp. strangulata TaxID=200361 RepID=A0A453KXJ7_AEGTS